MARSGDLIRPGDSAELRKARGAFFTPEAICTFVANWAVRSGSEGVLEPSCGEAAFLLAAGAVMAQKGGQGVLRGVELHPDSAQHAEALLGDQGLSATIEVGDFFTHTLGDSFDAVIGNPPYVRYQDFTGTSRRRALESAAAAGVQLSQLASSWAAFTVHAAQTLKARGRLGLVLPAEMLTVNYASPVRAYLLRRFADVRLLMFRERVFPGVTEEVVLLLAEGEGPSDTLRVCEVQDADSLSQPELLDWRMYKPGTGGRWSDALVPPEVMDRFSRLTGTGLFVPLLEWGDPNLGMVTGNNKYFALSPEDARTWGLEAHEVTPISPPGSRHLRNLALTRRAWTALGKAGARTLLFSPDPVRLGKGAKRYIAHGEAEGVQEAYKCRVRKNWWRVAHVPKADLFVTCMNHDAPRLVANTAKVLHLNSIHGLVLRPNERRLGTRQLPIGMLNSVTLLGAELHGRAYGGGILKLEPKEADRLPVPSPHVLARATEDLDGVRDKVEALLDDGRLVDAVSVVDDVLLGPHLGVSGADASHLQEARESLFSRRSSR